MVRLCLVASLLLGCAEDESASRCAKAGEVLARCHGIDATEFARACTDDPSPDTTALVDELLDPAASCNVNPDTKADGWGEAVFLQVCKPALQAAFVISRSRNGWAGEP